MNKNKKKTIIIGIVFLLFVLSGVILLNNNRFSDEPTNNEFDTDENVSVEVVKTNGDILYEVTSNYCYQTGDPDELYKIAEAVIIAEYLEDSVVNIERNQNPYTISKFKVKRVIKDNGNYPIGDTVLAKHSGGTVTLKELLNSRDDAFAQKIGAYDLSEEEIDKGKISFKNESIGDKTLEEEKVRMLFLGRNKNEKNFTIIANEYGMISYDETNETAFNYKTKQYSNYSFIK